LNAGGPKVTIISQTMADRYFGERDPIGQQIRAVVTDGEPAPWRTVIGVVGTWKHLANYAQWRNSSVVFRPSRTSFAFLVRARGDVNSVVADIRKEITAIELSVDSAVEPLPGRLSGYLLYPRFRAGLLACFGLGALLLAAIGLHAVLAQVVTQRTQEFGVRRAVGAQTRDLLWLVFRQSGTPVLVGLAAGIAAALGLTQLIRSMLYGVEPTDGRVLTATAVVLLVAAIAATALPAYRAAKVDPMVALRDE
jgi:putative ABC transport system permease protein